MRIIQMLPTLAFGDAIGNDVISLKQALIEMGYDTGVYACIIDQKLPKGTGEEISEYNYQDGDVILYHLSTGTDMNYKITEYPCKKIIMYHNVTPPKYFHHYSPEAEKNCADGLRAAKYLSKKADLCIADSAYNKKELIEMGYTCPIHVMPILIAFDDYKKKPSPTVIKEWDDDWVNIVFTGRVVPNKCPQDIIAAFAYYKKYINHKSRLFLVGRYDWSASYKAQLEAYIKKLNIEDVYMTGQVKFDEILAYYKISDVFVCMSEHEGFCVPLVEAMYFNVPIIAFDSSAISDTLGGSGLLLNDKSPEVVAEAIHLIVTQNELRDQLVEGEKERLKWFDHKRIKEQFKQIINDFTGEKII